jgi:hypothetical protein
MLLALLEEFSFVDVGGKLEHLAAISDRNFENKSLFLNLGDVHYKLFPKLFCPLETSFSFKVSLLEPNLT